MKLILIVLTLIALPSFATEICENRDFEFYHDVSEIVSASYPKMTMEFQLKKDCSYLLTSVVEMKNDDSNLISFFENLVINPVVNLSSSDRKRVVDITKAGPDQMVKVKKHGFTASVFSNCRYNIRSETKVVYDCTVDVKKSKILGQSLFQSNMTRIECTIEDRATKRCIFTTYGKAGEIPLLGNACDLAPPGAAETFNGIYRLSFYISQGNVDESKIKRGMDKISKLYNESNASKQKGKVDLRFSQVIE